MFSIYFKGDCFLDFESELYLINAAKREVTCVKDFIDEALDYLIRENMIYEEYKNRRFVEATDEDINFLKAVLKSMNKAVEFDLEKNADFYTMDPEDTYEHMVLLAAENSYMMLYWHTTA